MEGFPEYCFVETRSLCVSLICGDSLHSPWSARVPPEGRSLLSFFSSVELTLIL
ncbi:MAG: hypothetical protein RMX96_22220 [Nostoc sp. ChiSLP02]|nr:hypothetical protein [Nostoc sp. DedSLP05]MDZ8103578.1 hypothetical protein [Nostoc sp. DedSLP01]MDZ8187553.1 hypothetical protein [Nostoc sp. ChiSLP02]